ncbi:MAG TPA: class I SAM-dependent methyltransferase [Verrucomicrobiae bacterium]|nr:class I SAM-dependent methyltransferase [Verrucomicrobiae bacterium]
MRRFGYLFDPLFLLCCALYAVNRWLIKPHTHIVFFHSWFSDIWLIPCALPPVLLMQRWLGLRTHDDPPTLGEITAHLIGWSILFEVIGPHIMRTTGDVWDAVAYSVGAIIAFCWWRLVKSPANFDWLAPHYRWMEPILAGSKMQKCRTAFLSSIPPPRRALLVGEGHGRFLAALLAIHPQAQCVCLDASAGMLQAARERLGGDPRVEFVHADLAAWTPPAEPFDLIVTNFVFDCFTEEQLAALIPKLAAAAAPQARWLVADFCAPPRGLARWRAQAILAVMYVFFRWATGIAAQRLPEPAPLLVRAGFALRGRRFADWGLLHSDLWER